MVARFSAPVQTGPGAQTASYTISTEYFSGVKRPGRGVGHKPQAAPTLMKEYIYTTIPLRTFVACSRLNFTFTFL